MEFRDNLKAFREQAGLSGRELAKELNIPYSTYNKYESKGTEPKYDVLRQIAAILGVSIDALVGYYPDPKGTWLNEKLAPALQGSSVSIGKIDGDNITMSFRGKTWTIPINELRSIYDAAEQEMEDIERRKVLYRCLLEYFATH